ncbi:hypothetical protein ACFQ2T_05090 [Methylophilus flavus]|uniref:Transposase n=1 Tax=Methylophilus flavus TaxID=640084 RepID=A0ABW3P6P1_9PROT
MNRNEVALTILCAILSNSERWREISKLAGEKSLTRTGLNNDELTAKNINKAFKIADQFIAACADKNGEHSPL